MKIPKPTRRDLLVVIGRLQDMIGQAQAVAENDRSKNRLAETRAELEEAWALCVMARSQDPPLKDTGPWSSASRPVRERKRV